MMIEINEIQAIIVKHALILMWSELNQKSTNGFFNFGSESFKNEVKDYMNNIHEACMQIEKNIAEVENNNQQSEI